ncbi:MAG: hypothetical protein H6720_17705 [Sandaracinus sp.]|nr:hypothetical protein [Sandaracinus sp.]
MSEERQVTHLSRATAHDLRGRLNGLVLLGALLDDHSDPMVQKAVEKLRRATTELTELATALEAAGELFAGGTVAAIEGATFASLLEERSKGTWKATGSTDVRLVVDARALADALSALDPEPREVVFGSEGDAVTLRVEGVRPRLGSSPSLRGLRLELAAGPDAEVAIDESGLTVRVPRG